MEEKEEHAWERKEFSKHVTILQCYPTCICPYITIINLEHFLLLSLIPNTLSCPAIVVLYPHFLRAPSPADLILLFCRFCVLLLERGVHMPLHHHCKHTTFFLFMENCAVWMACGGACFSFLSNGDS